MNATEKSAPLLSEDVIARRVSELAHQISDDYRETDEVLLIGVLRGCFIFLADLCRQLTVPRKIDFLAAASYSDHANTAGNIRLLMDTRIDVQDRHVILVDDIIDTGYTLDFVVRTLKARQPASLATCILLRKAETEKVHGDADYLGFTIPNDWVVGYGLDYKDQHRALPYIAKLTPPAT